MAVDLNLYVCLLSCPSAAARADLHLTVAWINKVSCHFLLLYLYALNRAMVNYPRFNKRQRPRKFTLPQSCGSAEQKPKAALPQSRGTAERALPQSRSLKLQKLRYRRSCVATKQKS